MVVGGGISGIQAALDLGAAGFKVYLVEKSPTIGGKMAHLEKIFPTGEGIRFANIMNEFGREVEALGPLGQSEGIDRGELTARLERITRLIPYIKLVVKDKLAYHDAIQAEQEGYAGLLHPKRWTASFARPRCIPLTRTRATAA